CTFLGHPRDRHPLALPSPQYRAIRYAILQHREPRRLGAGLWRMGGYLQSLYNPGRPGHRWRARPQLGVALGVRPDTAKDQRADPRDARLPGATMEGSAAEPERPAKRSI